MTRSIHIPMGREARPPFVMLSIAVLAFVALECGGHKKGSVTSKADARGATPESTVTAPKGVEVQAASGNVPSPTEHTFGTADEAYAAADFRVAAEMFKAKLDSTPEDAYGRYMLGLSSWKSGDFEGAKAAFDKSIELDPKFAKAYFNEARVLIDLKRVPEALEIIEKGRAIDSTSSDVWRLTARAKAEGGDIDGAIVTYHELLVRDENDAWGLNNLGMLILDRGEVQEAIGPLARAVQVRPASPIFVNNLGMALEKAGHPVAALHRYELAVGDDSGYVKAVKNVERLKTIGTDSTLADEVDVGALAEEFRLKVRGWKEEVPKP